MFTSYREKYLEEQVEVLSKFLEKNPQYEEFTNVFRKFLYKDNYYCKISVGKNKGNYFQSYLSSILKNYNIVLSSYENEPQFIIKGHRGDTITVINLALIKNIHINTTKDKNGKPYIYEISFTYDQEDCIVDYELYFIDNNIS